MRRPVRLQHRKGTEDKRSPKGFCFYSKDGKSLESFDGRCDQITCYESPVHHAVVGAVGRQEWKTHEDQLENGRSVPGERDGG